MRVAFSGTHRTGKTSLLTDLSSGLPHYQCMDEPYHLLEDEGFEFSNPPSLEDFVVQLERSMELLDRSGPDVLFDRCPVDMLAYILCHPEHDAFDLDRWLPEVRTAMASLDLVVFHRILAHDRRWPLPEEDEEGTRWRVNRVLQELLVDDTLHLDVPVLPVEGDQRARATAVMRALTGGQLE